MRRNLPLPLLCQSNSTLSLSQVPIVQVVERVVEILKEVPIEVVKEVPVYVRTDVSDVEQHNRQKGQVTQCVLSTSLSLSLSLLSSSGRRERVSLSKHAKPCRDTHPQPPSLQKRALSRRQPPLMQAAAFVQYVHAHESAQ